MNISRQAIEGALQRVDRGWTLADSRPLSRRASALWLGSGAGAASRVVLLTHGERDRAFNPDIARDEYRLLQMLQSAGLPVARPLALIDDHEPPCLITSYVCGKPRLAADDAPALCGELAEILSAIHAFDIGQHDVSFLPRLEDVLAKDLDGGGDLRIRRVLGAVHGGVCWNEPVLLHGDFWLGNLLWQGDSLSGIVDWEDAMLGDPLADLGKSRLEMLWALGEAAMEWFTAQYLRLNKGLEASALPFWDLWGALRLSHFASFAEDEDAGARMRSQYDGFVEAALRLVG